VCAVTEHIVGMVSGLVLLAVSVTLRSRRMERISARQVEGIASPMSRAIQATVGYAGGIYMTLVMLASFLQVEVPEKILITNGFLVEPLAFVAVVLAFIQPFFLIIWDKMKR
jgi:hypothetical protein